MRSPLAQFGWYLSLHQWALSQHRKTRHDYFLRMVKDYAASAAFAAKQIRQGNA